MRDYVIRKCVDCGREFKSWQSRHNRCPECQAKRKKELMRQKYKNEYKPEREKKNKGGSMVVDGHVQVCQYLDSCYYGQGNKHGCSYSLEEGKTRLSQGLYIKNGKCPAYRKKKPGEKTKRQTLEPYNFSDEQGRRSRWFSEI